MRISILVLTPCFLWLSQFDQIQTQQQQAVAYYVDQNGQVVETVQNVPYFSGPIQPQAAVPAAAPGAFPPPPPGAPPVVGIPGLGVRGPGRRSRLFPNGFRFDSDSMNRLGETIGKFLSGFLGANKGGSINLDRFRNFIPPNARSGLEGGQSDTVRPRGRGRIRPRGRGRGNFVNNPDGFGGGPDTDLVDPGFEPIPPVISSNLDQSPNDELDYFEDSRYMPTANGKGPPVGRPPNRPRPPPRPQNLGGGTRPRPGPRPRPAPASLRPRQGPPRGQTRTQNALPDSRPPPQRQGARPRPRPVPPESRGVPPSRPRPSPQQPSRPVPRPRARAPSQFGGQVRPSGVRPQPQRDRPYAAGQAQQPIRPGVRRQLNQRQRFRNSQFGNGRTA